MSVFVSAYVWRHSNAEGSTRLVLLALADIADDDGIVPPHRDASIDRIASKCKLSRRAVQYCLRELEGKPSEREGRVIRPGIKPPELAIAVGVGKRPSRYQILMRQLALFEPVEHDLPAESGGAEAVDKPLAEPESDVSKAQSATSNVQPASPLTRNLQHLTCTRVHPNTRIDVKRRKRRNDSAQARDPSPPPVDKKPDKPDKPDKPAGEYDLTPTLIAWGAENGYAAYLHLHLGVFRDYLLQKPAYAKKHADALDACFRNCVRADWGKVRQQAQIAARMGQGPDLERWWATSDGMKAKGMSMGLPWDPARYRTFVQYEVSIIDAAIDRDGWGSWIDKGRNSQMYGWVVERRQKRGADVPEGEEIHA